MSGYVAVAGSLLFPVLAALVTQPSSSAGGEAPPPTGWQSDALKAAVAQLKKGFVGADVAMARTLGECVAAVGASRPRKNRAWPGLPFVDREDIEGAHEQMFDAIDEALRIADVLLGAGASMTRGLVLVHSAKSGLGTLSFQRYAAEQMRAGEALPDAWKLTAFGQQYKYACENYRGVKLLTSNPSEYLLGVWWKQLWLVAESADAAGMPPGGEHGPEGDGGGVSGWLRKAWELHVAVLQRTSGYFVEAHMAVGRVVAGVVGDAAWAIISSPPGLLAIAALSYVGYRYVKAALP